MMQSSHIGRHHRREVIAWDAGLSKLEHPVFDWG
jgi:hypothetical protein